MENSKINVISRRWFEVKAKGVVYNDKGNEKTVTKKYVFPADSWSECEQLAKTKLEEEFVIFTEILDMSIAPYTDVAITDADYCCWYKVKLYIETVDDNGNGKRSPYYVLTNANSIDSAQSNAEQVFYGTMETYSIGSVVDTSIVNVLGI